MGEGTIHGCFREWAGVVPSAVCVRQGPLSLTYGQLDELSDGLAAELCGLGVGPGSMVPVLLPRSPLFVAVLLGVLKAGAAYAALDVSWPAARVAEIVAQLPSPVVAADRAVAGVGERRVWVPGYSPAGGLAVPEVVVGGQDPCSVFFTSGSSGVPKGAVVPHEGTVRLLRGASFARFGPGSVMPQAAPLPWDGLSLELWGMLVTGGTSLLMEPGPLSSARLRWAAGQGATVALVTTSLFHLFVEEDVGCFAGLGQVIVGGERLSAVHARRFLEHHPRVRLTNGYGPAETTVILTAHDVGLGDCGGELGVPLGRALPDTGLLVLDGDRECADGEPGELCVTGPRVGLGYLGGVAGGFTRWRTAAGEQRMYRTGDLVTRRDGLLHYLGRSDQQVKIRGHRVEPGGHELPATLPAAQPQRAIVSPATDPELEHLVAAEIAALLGVAELPVDVGIRAFGATSLDLIRICLRVQRSCGVFLPLERLPDDPDVRAVAAAVSAAPPSARSRQTPQPGSAGRRPAEVRLTPLAGSFLVRHEIDPADRSALCPLIWRIQGPLDLRALRLALDDVRARHESLRASYQVRQDPVALPQAPAPAGPVLRVLPGTSSWPQAWCRMRDWLFSERLDVANGQVWRASVTAVSGTSAVPAEHVLGVVVHHVAFDGWSEGVLARELALAYRARRYRGAAPGGSPPAGMAELAQARSWREEPARQRASLRYWSSRLAGAAELDFTDGRPAATGPDARRACFLPTRDLPAAQVAPWSALAAAHGRTLFPALLAVYTRCLGRFLTQPDVVTGTPVVMRDMPIEDDAIGCFLNMLCLRVADVPAATWADAISHAGRELAMAMTRRDAGLPDLVRELRPKRGNSTPLYQTICVLQDNARPELDLPGCRSSFHRSQPPDAATQIIAEFSPAPDGGLHLDLSYQEGYVLPRVAAGVADDLMATLLAGPAGTVEPRSR